MQGGREGVEAEWEKTDEFHNAWKAKSREMLARAEFRRRKLTKRVGTAPLCLKLQHANLFLLLAMPVCLSAWPVAA